MKLFIYALFIYTIQKKYIGAEGDLLNNYQKPKAIRIISDTVYIFLTRGDSSIVTSIKQIGSLPP